MKKAVIILALLLAISAAYNIIYIRARVSGGADGQTRPDTVRLVDTLRYVSPAPTRDTIIRYVRVRLPSTPPAPDNPGSQVNPGNSAESAEKAAADTDTAAVGFNYDFDFWAYTDAWNQSQGGLEEHDCLQTWEYPLDEDKENGKRLTHCPFRLRETKSPCIVTDAWKNTEIDTRVVHTVQFTDQAISFDPTATYIIHGRRFACKKIELKITDRGLSPLKTGYFYEIKD